MSPGHHYQPYGWLKCLYVGIVQYNALLCKLRFTRYHSMQLKIAVCGILCHSLHHDAWCTVWEPARTMVHHRSPGGVQTLSSSSPPSTALPDTGPKLPHSTSATEWFFSLDTLTKGLSQAWYIASQNTETFLRQKLVVCLTWSIKKVQCFKICQNDHTVGVVICGFEFSHLLN